MWQVTRVLIVCPVSTILNWENEFKIWLPGGTMKLMAPGGGVMKIGYEMFRGLANQKNNPSGQNLFTRCLVEAGHSILINVFCIPTGTLQPVRDASI